MFPIKDTIRARNFPLVNWLLIAANACAFFIELCLSPIALQGVIEIFGLVPAKLSLSNPFSWITLISYMFLHGGWFHFLSNVWILFIFGDNVEDRMGSVRYLFFYILGGIAAGLLQVFVMKDSLAPSIGASGAIAAVLGAYILFYPRARVITLIPIFIIPWFVEISAFIFLGFWFVSQLFSGVLSLATSTGAALEGVAWWAHIGGFLFGLIFARLFAFKIPSTTWHQDEYYPW